MRLRRDPKKFMTALSVRQPYANRIADGEKKEEFRRWNTNYRGPLLIVSAKTLDYSGEKDYPDRNPRGVAICIVNLVNVIRDKWDSTLFHWQLENPRRVKPVKIRGNSSLFSVRKSLVKMA